MKRKICIINPNTTKAMTQKIDLTAKNFASKDTEIISVEPKVGPDSIEGFYDEAFCIPGLVEEIKKQNDADAYIIACFDDTGLEVIRSITEKPVIGIGEATYHVATMIAGNFTVITTLSRSIRPLTHNLKKYGLFENCVKVTAIEVPVLDLENISSENLDKLNKVIQDTMENDNAEAIILGCAGMADLASNLEIKHKLPVIEGISSAVVLAESLVNLKIKTSKVGSYALPRKKEYMGYLNKFKP
ncbi:aspartate/glutamate racemase family protein [Alphaproteobacteria bacterium]|nr:aspartate/glutamate racemase family protein [Alphaproteobacteria bacterium]MDB2684083.1 aspartate/glutamate racemase family protein [Alphaproteobacteria bacterium]